MLNVYPRSQCVTGFENVCLAPRLTKLAAFVAGAGPEFTDFFVEEKAAAPLFSRHLPLFFLFLLEKVSREEKFQSC